MVLFFCFLILSQNVVLNPPFLEGLCLCLKISCSRVLAPLVDARLASKKDATTGFFLFEELLDGVGGDL